MDIRLIAIIKNVKKKIIGFRLLDVNKGQLSDVDINSVKKVLTERKASIAGLKMEGQMLVGTNGRLDRYPTIINNRLHGKSPLIIIKQFIVDDMTVGYRVSDWNGRLLNLSTKDVVRYAKEQGISNGAIRDLGDKEIVSSISGEYDKVIKKSSNKTRIEEIKKMEDDIENTIWTMDDFIKYMNIHGYKYNFKESDYRSDKEIEFQSNMKIIKYPVDIKSINNYFANNCNMSDARLIIIPPSVDEVTYNILNDAMLIEKIVIQEGSKITSVSGIKGSKYGGNAVNEVVIPKSVERLYYGLSNFTELKQLDLYNTNLESISGCFNNIGRLRELKLPETLRSIESSFNDCMSLEKIEINSEIENIKDGNFRNIPIKELDLSRCKNLKRLGYGSFCDCYKLEKVELPEGLESIDYGCFSCNNRLKEVRIPESLKEIGGNAFSKSLIEDVTLGKNIKRVGGGAFNTFTRIKVEDGVTEIKESMFDESIIKSISLPDSIERIGFNAFRNNTNLESIEVRQDSGDRLEFRGYKKIDLRGADKLKEIGEGAFAGSRVELVILPEGLEKINKDCFVECNYMQYLVLPSTLEKIERGALMDIGSAVSFGVIFVVKDGTMAEKYCKRNKYRYISINTLRDLHEYLYDDTEISSNKKAKLRMMLSNSDMHKELLQEDFINNADVLFKIYNHITSPLSQNIINNAKLDTSKFREHGIDSSKLLREPLKRIENIMREDGIQNLDTSFMYKDNMTTRFINLSNLITSLFEYNELPISEGGTEYITNDALSRFNITYTDRYNSIITYNIRHKIDSNIESTVVLIVMSGKIVFSTLIDKNSSSIVEEILKSDNTIKSTVNNSVAELFDIGDILILSGYSREYCTIKSNNFPKYIYDTIMRSIVNHFKVIGCGGAGVYSSPTIKNEIIDIMCMDTGNIITVQGDAKKNSGGYVSKLEYIKNIMITDIRSFNDMSDETKKRIMSGIESEKSIRLFERVVGGSEYTKKLSKLSTAYDNDGDYVWRLSQLLNELKINVVEDLRYQVYDVITNTEFFLKRRYTKNEAFDLGDVIKTTDIMDEGLVVVEIKLEKPVRSKKIADIYAYNMTGLIDTNAVGGKKLDFFISSGAFSYIFNKIVNMRKTGDMENKITDNMINHDDYIECFETVCEQKNKHYSSGIQYSLSIDICKSNGGVFLMGRIGGIGIHTRYYTILRFKSLELALKHYGWISEENYKDEHDNMMYNFVNLVREIETNGKYDYDVLGKSNLLGYVRGKIIDGIPNKHHIDIRNIELFDDLAKQPK